MDNEINFDTLIGVDETGVGDYFSPIVSVACFIPTKNIEKIKELGVKDSKKLSENKIKELAPKLEKLTLWRKNILSQKGYNNLIANKINNNEIKTLIHSNSINSLLAILNEPVDVIIDQYTNNEETFYNHYKKLKNIDWLKIDKPQVKIYLKTKAEDKSLSVACASVIARNILLNLMDLQIKNYNFPFKLGANSEVDNLAAKFLKENSIEKLKEVAKISFKTTFKAIEINNLLKK
ncbi:ribonuclease HIII [Metamycoplasma buccale]|uniref:ribonuclease HIII n=1 Tax=Metamycoplasma buccale TaxID=55602 RepID=UPI00398F32F3